MTRDGKGSCNCYPICSPKDTFSIFLGNIRISSIYIYIRMILYTYYIILLYYVILYYIILYYIILYCIILYLILYIILYYIYIIY